MELTNAQYQRLCNVANVRHDDPSINELISAFQMQRINLVACENALAECRKENERLRAERDDYPHDELINELNQIDYELSRECEEIPGSDSLPY